MELEVTERADDVTQVALVGRLDITGMQAVDLRFHALTAAASRPALIDLGRLEYIASLGMGMLVSCAQSLHAKGHRFVLFGATGEVDAALRRTGLDNAIPMAPDLASALQVLGEG